MRHLHDAVLCKRPDLWTAQTWQLRDDNVPACSSHLIQTFLGKHNTAQLCQSPYSPEMAPCDFWLFPKLKMSVKGTGFESRKDIVQNTTRQLTSRCLER